MWVPEWCHPQRAQPAARTSSPVSAGKAQVRGVAVLQQTPPASGCDIVCVLRMLWGVTHWGRDEHTGWCLAQWPPVLLNVMVGEGF